MEKIDYNKLDLRCGLEIHRQINTKKLFCRCPSILREDKPNIKVKRYLRAVVSEIGEKDIVAEYEMSKGRYAIYEAYSDTNCEIELDEAPPFPINPDALAIVIQTAQLLNAKIVDEMQVMRKQVLDYSNTSSFQRTVLIAIDGYIQTSKGKVGIQTVCLEEDAARKIEETKEYIVYRLDRLGIPLIEIATAPDVKTPEHGKEVAEKLGMMLKSTGGYKSGIGTIRQDLNVSIENGARIEIKGVQDLKSIPKVIEKEVQRQSDLIEKRKKVLEEVRKANLDNSTGYMRPMPGAARMYVETDIPTIKPELKKVKKVELIEDKIKKFEKLGLSHSLAVLTARSNKAGMFERFIEKFENIKPAFIAETLTATLREIKRKYNIDVEKLTETEFEEIFNYLEKGKIAKDVVIDVLIDYVNETFKDIEKYSTMSYQELEKEIKKILEEKKDLSFGAYMGIIMNKLKGRVSGQKASEILKKLLK